MKVWQKHVKTIGQVKEPEKIMVHLNCWSSPGILLHVVEGDFQTVSAEKTIQEL